MIGQHEYLLCDRCRYTFPSEGSEIIAIEESTGVRRAWNMSDGGSDIPTIALDRDVAGPVLTFAPDVNHSLLNVVPRLGVACIEREFCIDQGLDARMLFSEHIDCQATEFGKPTDKRQYFFGKMRWSKIETLPGCVKFSESFFEEIGIRDLHRHIASIEDGSLTRASRIPRASHSRKFASLEDYQSIPAIQRSQTRYLIESMEVRVKSVPILFTCFQSIYLLRSVADALAGAKKPGLLSFGEPCQVSVLES